MRRARTNLVQERFGVYNCLPQCTGRRRQAQDVVLAKRIA